MHRACALLAGATAGVPMRPSEDGRIWKWIGTLRRGRREQAGRTLGDRLELGPGPQFTQLFELAPRDRVTLVALAADRRGWRPLPSAHEACGTSDLVGTTLRPLA